MSNYKMHITDALTGETIEREMNDEEKAARDAVLAELAAEDVAAEALAKQVATDKAALLAKLGITADEAKLLLS